MTVANPFKITYGTVSVGGDSATLQLLGPYTISLSHSQLRVAFDAIVVATDFDTLHSISTLVEEGFRKRDVSLSIEIDGEEWDYTHGQNVLNVRASCAKSGNRETDRGYSRAYTVTIEGELPATDQDGLRDLEVMTSYTAARQKMVTMRGTYSALSGDLATATYLAEFTARADVILFGIDGAATWELVEESHGRDRLDHATAFSRQYVQILAEQSIGILNDPQIRDHRVAFSESLQHPGDSLEGIHRMRRVRASYDAAVVVTETQALDTVARDKVLPHLLALFSANFTPRVYGVEEQTITTDPTRNLVSIVAQFVYVTNEASNILEVEESIVYQEVRNIDYTPIHDGGETSAYADVGFMIRERTFSRTAMILADDTKDLDGSSSSTFAPRTASALGAAAVSTGWNKVRQNRRATTRWVGDPQHVQFRVAIVSDEVTSRYHSTPDGGGGGGGGGSWLFDIPPEPPTPTVVTIPY